MIERRRAHVASTVFVPSPFEPWIAVAVVLVIGSILFARTLPVERPVGAFASGEDPVKSLQP